MELQPIDNMNREIKFRVWDGSRIEYDVIVGKVGTFYVNPDNNGLDKKDNASLTPFNTIYTKDIPVMQFTGLKDKNGKEIYEGDIVRQIDYEDWGDTKGYTYIGVVRFELCDDVGYGHKFAGYLSYPHPDSNNYGHVIKTECEVIGNIYQNPELLKYEQPLPRN